MKPIFLTYFPNYRDIHLFKDPGQIPFRFQKALGYESYIICNSGHNEVEDTKQYIHLLILPKSRIKRYFKLISFFIKNKKRIKIFNIFQIGFHNVFIATLCKAIVPHVFIYVKMDNCSYTGPYPWEKIFDKTVSPNKVFPFKKESYFQKVKNFILKNYLIYKVDLFSVEDNDSKDYYEKKYPFFRNKIVTVYNGHVADLNFINNIKNYNEKENIILTVGRLGTYPKNTVNLMEGFSRTTKEHDWSLHLAGPVDNTLDEYIEAYFSRYPWLRKRIHFHGNLDKKELFSLYNRSKIFILPSIFEGFAIAYSEAMFFGNAIITSYNTSVRKIIMDNKLGILINPEKSVEIGNAIKKLVNKEADTKQMAANAKIFSNNFLNWDQIVEALNKEIESRNLPEYSKNKI